MVMLSVVSMDEQDAELLLARLLVRIGKASQALTLLHASLPSVLEHGHALTRALTCMLIGKCELLLCQQAGTSTHGLYRAVKWLERCRVDLQALGALLYLRETAYLLVGVRIDCGGLCAVCMCC